MFKLKFPHIIVLIVCASMMLTQVVPVFARSIDDIQDDINQQTSELAKIKKQLQDAQANLSKWKGSLASAQGQIPKLEAQIQEVQATIDLNKVQIDLTQKQQKLKELEQEDREARQLKAVKLAYLDWRSENKAQIGMSGAMAESMRKEVYQAKVAAIELEGVEGLIAEVLKIKGDLASLQSDTNSLEKQDSDLQKLKAQLEAQVVALRNSVNTGTSLVAGLNTKAGSIRSNIAQLSAEQKALEDYEAWLLGQNAGGATKTVANGNLYFTGVGRDLYQGHGVGMSQWGAYGLAQHGWTASQILKHYYTGVAVGQYAMNKNLTIKYCKNNPVFAAYQENCIANGKDYGPVVTERVSFDDYLSGLGEVPASWPLQARSAQIIAARTYAINYTNNGNSQTPICLTVYCQVSYIKDGNKAQKDAVDATKDLVITYGGQMISALYSADNNNGIWGTADNDTRFSDLAGNGTPYPYLRAVKEPQDLVAKTQYTNYNYRTDGYTLNPVQKSDGSLTGNSIKNLLDFAARDPQLSTSSRNFVDDIRRQLGKIGAIDFVRDPSKRVKKVVIYNTNGVSRTLAGWFFKTIWNSWVYQVHPNGEVDYIYSQTYFAQYCGTASGCTP